MAQPLVALGVENPKIDTVGDFIKGESAGMELNAEQMRQAKQGIQTMGAMALGVMNGDINGQADPERWNQAIDYLQSRMGSTMDLSGYKDHPELASVVARAALDAGQQLEIARDERDYNLSVAKFNQTISNAARERMAEADKRSRALTFLKERDPELAAQFEAGRPIGDIFKALDEAGGTADFEAEMKLRKEYEALPGVKDYGEQERAYRRVLDSASKPSAAGDLALIFNYMKILDPGSVVRESEFATAAASGSYGERLKAAGEQILSGKRLSDEQRRDFVTQAGNQFKGANELLGSLNSRYTNLANEYKASPDRIVRQPDAFGVLDPNFNLETYLSGSPAADDPLGIR